MRNYIVASWSDADQYDYSGEMLGGSRHKGRSQRVHFNADGSACVASYSDPEPKSKISIADRILPQKRRLDKLNDEIRELEDAYRSGEISLKDYSLLRDVAFSKRDRQEVLYKRAASVKPKSSETDEDGLEYTPSSGFSPSPNDGYASEEYVDCGVEFIDSLSETNSLKNMLKKACIITRKVIHYKHKMSSYLQTLKEV